MTQAPPSSEHPPDSRSGASVVFIAVLAATLVAQQVAGKATRDAFYLQNFDAQALATIMTVTAVVSLGAAWGLSAWLMRTSPIRVTPKLLALNGLLFGIECFLSNSSPATIATLTYLHTGALGIVVISAFWSLVGEALDPHTARTSMGRIGTGAAAGGVVGGAVSWGVSHAGGVTAILGVLAVVNLACAAIARRVPRHGDAMRKAESGEPSPSPIEAFRGSKHLWHLCALVVLAALADALVEFAFKARAAETRPGGLDLPAFFSLFYAATSVIVLLVQAGATQSALNRLGLATTAAGLPGTNLVGGALAMLFPGFLSAAALRLTTTAAEHSLFRSAYEVAYVPIPPDKKRPTKALIDAGADKVGAVAGSALALILVAAIAQNQALLVAMAVVVAAGVASIPIARALGRGYEEALADGLRTGAFDLDSKDLIHSTTRDTYARTMALDPEKVRAEVAAWQQRNARSNGPMPMMSLYRARKQFESREPARIRQVLAQYTPLPFALLAPTIALLDHDEVLSEVVVALQGVAEQHVGILSRHLLDPNTSPVIRRRLPRILRACPTQAAADALTRALSDPEFTVRYRSGVALLRLKTKCPDLDIDEAAVLDAVRRETEADRETLLAERTADGNSSDDELPAEQDAHRELPPHAVTHIFTLLATVLESEPLLLAYSFVAMDETELRGTALEYLALVLPEDIRDRLWPCLTDHEVPSPSSRAELVDALRASQASLTFMGGALHASEPRASRPTPLTPEPRVDKEKTG